MQNERKSNKLGAACLFGVILAAVGCKSSPPQSGPAEVGIVTLQSERVILTTELPGRTSAYLIAEIRPQVNGILKKRLFQEGSEVQAGSVLYQIDPDPYQAAYDQAKAALGVAEAALPAIRSRAERLKNLAEIHAVGQQDADEAQAALQQAEANVAAAKAAADSARINLSYTPIKAPITGRTGKSSVTVGALVTAYQPVTLATIQQLDPIYVDVTQSSADLLRLRRAMQSGHLAGGVGAGKVKLLLEDGTPYPREGKLEFRDVTVEPSTGSVTIRLVFPNPDRVLLPGMFVRAVVEEGVSENAILALQQGVTRNPKGDPMALVVDKDGKVEQRMLELDRAVGDRWLVIKGLAPNDRLIVDGLQKVRPGDLVKAVPFTGTQPEEKPAGDGKPAQGKG